MRGTPAIAVMCEGCGSDQGFPKSKLCRACQVSRTIERQRKYTFTPEMDAMIRRIYADNAGDRRELRRGLDRFAQQYRFPRHVPRYRAQRLGVTKDTRNPWKPEEIETLEELAGTKPAKVIAEMLGRGVTTVQAMMDRLKLRRTVTEGYSREQVSEVTGAAWKTVARWIGQGLLVVNEATDRVTEKSLIRFLKAHPECYSLKRVDEMWFKSVMFPTRAVIGQSETQYQPTEGVVLWP